jgi:hypothetical protein
MLFPSQLVEKIDIGLPPLLMGLMHLVLDVLFHLSVAIAVFNLLNLKLMSKIDVAQRLKEISHKEIQLA